MDVLVGSKGYIGSHLSDRLNELRCPFISIPTRHGFYNRIQQLNTQSIGTVYWCASGVMPNSNSREIHEGIAEFEYFCNFIREFHPHSNIVLLSTIGLANYDPHLLHENNGNSISKYYENRYRYEQKLAESACRSVVLRISNVYGPNVSRQFGVIANWIRCIQEDIPISVTDSLENSRDYIYIDDVVDAIIASGACGDGQILDLGSGLKSSLGQLIQLFSELIQFEVTYITSGELASARTIPEINLNKIHSAIDWSPRFSLREGLELVFKHEGLL